MVDWALAFGGKVPSMYRFEIFKDNRGDWRWRLKAPNGPIVADSAEAYASKWNAKRAVRAIYKNTKVI